MASLQPVHLDTALALSQIGDAVAMRSMLAMLEETLGRDIPQITVLLQQGDVAGAGRMLHPLKGFIPIFCSPDLCHQVVDVEGLCKYADAATVGAAYAGLRPELERLLREVADFLAAG